MSKYYKRIMGMTVVVSLLLAGRTMGGALDPTNAPGPTMHTLEEIYQKVSLVSTDVVSVVVSTNITQTFFDASVQKTGQTNSHATADDGDLEKGVAWPSPRFTDNLDGTVTDNLTELIWLENANAFNTRTWLQALTDCNTLSNGMHGLTDGSVAGDWRLPSRFELESLLDLSQSNPALPSGHLFTGVQYSRYWSGTSRASNIGFAWLVLMNDGFLDHGNKALSYFVWPVRGGP